MSEDPENKKKDLTVGGVSGSKKMRRGRFQEQQACDGPELLEQHPDGRVRL